MGKEQLSIGGEGCHLIDQDYDPKKAVEAVERAQLARTEFIARYGEEAWEKLIKPVTSGWHPFNIKS